jgi:4-oxalocrotonate tautomerase
VALDEAGWTASLVAHVTAGTNTEAEQAAFIAQAHTLIAETFGRPATAPIYIVVDEIPATGWGYDGRTQHARRVAPSADGR